MCAVLRPINQKALQKSRLSLLGFCDSRIGRSEVKVDRMKTRIQDVVMPWRRKADQVKSPPATISGMRTRSQGLLEETPYGRSLKRKADKVKSMTTTPEVRTGTEVVDIFCGGPRKRNKEAPPATTNRVTTRRQSGVAKPASFSAWNTEIYGAGEAPGSGGVNKIKALADSLEYWMSEEEVAARMAGLTAEEGSAVNKEIECRIAIDYCPCSGNLFKAKADELKAALERHGCNVKVTQWISRGCFAVSFQMGGPAIFELKGMKEPYQELVDLDMGSVVKKVRDAIVKIKSS